MFKLKITSNKNLVAGSRKSSRNKFNITPFHGVANTVEDNLNRGDKNYIGRNDNNFNAVQYEQMLRSQGENYEQ